LGKEKAKNDRIRYNILTILVYIVGIVLLAQLFNLQIVHGEEYRETSNTKLTRESVLKADRGSIKDSSGTMLATVDAQYSISRQLVRLHLVQKQIFQRFCLVLYLNIAQMQNRILLLIFFS
jgi:cell division protein FtsI/penicillin-binding protein 2